jgi:hypothetical protein
MMLRITSLMLHRYVDDGIEPRMIDVGLWWSEIDEA